MANIQSRLVQRRTVSFLDKNRVDRRILRTLKLKKVAWLAKRNECVRRADIMD